MQPPSHQHHYSNEMSKLPSLTMQQQAENASNNDDDNLRHMRFRKSSQSRVSSQEPVDLDREILDEQAQFPMI